MPRGKQNKKGAAGAGTIRRKVIHRDGKEYVYWEARYTIGFDPGTGKQKQRSITAKTQKEAAQKLRQATTELDRGIYQEPCKMQLGAHLKIPTVYHNFKKIAEAAATVNGERRPLAIDTVRRRRPCLLPQQSRRYVPNDQEFILRPIFPSTRRPTAGSPVPHRKYSL